VTGTATTGNTSNWAMKLETNPNATYPITIQNNFNNYHVVPEDYTMVAKRTAGTDVGSSATGSVLTSTYQVYVSPLQFAGTYIGKVKYVLVHPNDTASPVRPDRIAVEFHGNGRTFSGGSNVNKVQYGDTVTTTDAYVGNNPEISKTNNVGNDGTQNGPVDSSSTYNDSVTIQGADALIVRLNYDLDNQDVTRSLTDIGIHVSGEEFEEIYFEAGTEELLIMGDTVDFTVVFPQNVDPEHDYGYYAQIYPVYAEPTENTTLQDVVLSRDFEEQTGTYEDTTPQSDWWYIIENGNYHRYFDEADVVRYLEQNKESLLGTTVELYAAIPYTIVFNSNGGSGTMSNQTVYPYYQTSINNSTFTMSNKEVISWNTEPDGTGESFNVNETLNDPIADIDTTITLYAQWGDCRPDRICYDDAGANSTTKMGRQTVNSNSSVILWASNFKRQGYGFAGWNTEPDGTGTNYGPNETITTGNLSTEGIRLYAKWIQSEGNIQNWNGCSSMDVGDVTALADTRDNNTYAVAKLADGNCWMIENLRLGGSSAIQLTLSNSQSEGSLPASTNTFGSSANTKYMNASNTMYPVSTMNRANSSVYSYGNYYSWAAAVNSTNNYSTATNVTTSICPAGWSLPIGGTSGENPATSGAFHYYGISLGAFDNNGFATANASDLLRQYPNNYVLSGYQYYSLKQNSGSTGNYWSARAVQNSSCGLIITTNSASLPSSVERYLGDTVRCVMVMTK
ncbi:InlB B-repeat-containing protein, partial [Candidatus Saccharibacteria bacterium]|nr:InlB B-repeat-containing protein [Candidatus Saccharibacteria bacterium]